jgi:phosphoglycolate phosphatase
VTLEAVVFDLDGTLVDSAPAIAATLEQMRKKRGIRAMLDIARVRQWVSGGAEELVRNALGTMAGDNAADVAEFRAVYAAADTPPESLYPGIAETLEELATQGLRLGVCSNKPQKLCDKVLGDVGIHRFFRAIIGGDAVPNRKPHPAHLVATLQAVGTRPPHAIYVGDSSIDLLTAQAAGVGFVLAVYGYLDEPLAGGALALPPAARIGSPGELAPLIANWRI